MENLVFKEKFECIRTLEIEVLSKQRDGSFFIRASTSFFDAEDGGVITQSSTIGGLYYNPKEKYFYNKRYKNGDEIIKKIKWSNDVWFVKLILKAIENEMLE